MGRYIHRFTVLGFVAYLLLLIRFVLLKTPSLFLYNVKHWQSGNIKAGWHYLRLVPFKTTMICLRAENGIWNAMENLGGNLLGFIPMGIMLPMLFAGLRSARRTVTTVFSISLGFELVQFLTGVGYCDIDDLWQNTLGGAMGYWLFRNVVAKHCPYSTNTNAAHK